MMCFARRVSAPLKLPRTLRADEREGRLGMQNSSNIDKENDVRYALLYNLETRHPLCL